VQLERVGRRRRRRRRRGARLAARARGRGGAARGALGRLARVRRRDRRRRRVAGGPLFPPVRRVAWRQSAARLGCTSRRPGGHGVRGHTRGAAQPRHLATARPHPAKCPGCHASALPTTLRRQPAGLRARGCPPGGLEGRAVARAARAAGELALGHVQPGVPGQRQRGRRHRAALLHAVLDPAVQKALRAQTRLLDRRTSTQLISMRCCMPQTIRGLMQARAPASACEQARSTRCSARGTGRGPPGTRRWPQGARRWALRNTHISLQDAGTDIEKCRDGPQGVR
jgi:hypothetical protein